MTRTPAQPLSEAEAAIVARAPVPAEVVVETVARAIAAESHGLESMDEDGWEYYLRADEQEDFLRLAAAAIAALPPSPAEEAVKRVEALAGELEALAWAAADDYEDDLAFAFERAADHIRAALASPAPAPQGEEGQR